MEQQGLPGFFHVVSRFGYNERVVQDASFVQVASTSRHHASLLIASAVLTAP